MRVRSWRSEKACIYAVFPVVSSFLRHKKRVLLHSFRLCHFSDILFVNFTSPQSLLNPHKSRIYKVFSHLIPCCPTLSRFVNYLVNIHPYTEWDHFHPLIKDKTPTCIFRKNCASVPEERSAIPLQTEQSSAG